MCQGFFVHLEFWHFSESWTQYQDIFGHPSARRGRPTAPPMSNLHGFESNFFGQGRQYLGSRDPHLQVTRLVSYNICTKRTRLQKPPDPSEVPLHSSTI